MYVPLTRARVWLAPQQTCTTPLWLTTRTILTIKSDSKFIINNGNYQGLPQNKIQYWTWIVTSNSTLSRPAYWSRKVFEDWWQDWNANQYYNCIFSLSHTHTHCMHSLTLVQSWLQCFSLLLHTRAVHTGSLPSWTTDRRDLQLSNAHCHSTHGQSFLSPGK